MLHAVPVPIKLLTWVFHQILKQAWITAIGEFPSSKMKLEQEAFPTWSYPVRVFFALQCKAACTTTRVPAEFERYSQETSTCEQAHIAHHASSSRRVSQNSADCLGATSCLLKYSQQASCLSHSRACIVMPSAQASAGNWLNKTNISNSCAMPPSPLCWRPIWQHYISLFRISLRLFASSAWHYQLAQMWNVLRVRDWNLPKPFPFQYLLCTGSFSSKDWFETCTASDRQTSLSDHSFSCVGRTQGQAVYTEDSLMKHGWKHWWIWNFNNHILVINCNWWNCCSMARENGCQNALKIRLQGMQKLQKRRHNLVGYQYWMFIAGWSNYPTGRLCKTTVCTLTPPVRRKCSTYFWRQYGEIFLI